MTLHIQAERHAFRRLGGLARTVLILSLTILIVMIHNNGLFAQSKTSKKKPAVYILKTNGCISQQYGYYTITVYGTVGNTLLRRVRDVDVEVEFPGANKKKTRRIMLIKPNKTGHFSVSIKQKFRASRYIPRLVSYRIDSSDVASLLNHFWEGTGDILRREAAVGSISELRLKDYRPVIARFRRGPVKKTLYGDSNRDIIETLIMLPLMIRSGRADAVRALVDKAVICDNLQYRLSYRVLKNLAVKGPTLVPQLNRMARNTASLSEQLCDSAATIGDVALPELLSIGRRDYKTYRYAAYTLRRMGIDNEDKRIAALVTTSQQGSPTQLRSMQTQLAAIPMVTTIHALVNALEKVAPTRRAIIYQWLQHNWTRAQPQILANLTRQQWQAPHPEEPEKIIQRLQTLILQRHLLSLRSRYGTSKANLSTLKRLTAEETARTKHLGPAKAFDSRRYSAERALLNRHFPSQSSVSSPLPDLFHALNQSLSLPSSWDRALDLYPLLYLRMQIARYHLDHWQAAQEKKDWQTCVSQFKVLTNYTADLGMAPRQEAQLYLRQGRAAQEAGQLKAALTHFRQAAVISGDPRVAGTQAGKIVLKQHWLMITLLLLLALFTAAIVRKEQLDILRDRTLNQ